MKIHLTLDLPDMKGIQQLPDFWVGWIQSDLDSNGIKGAVSVYQPEPPHAAFQAMSELREAANDYIEKVNLFKSKSVDNADEVWRDVSAAHLKLQTLRDRHGV